MEKIRIIFPSRLIHKISQDSPSYQAGEIYGRSEEYGRSYKCISIYVQNGLYDQIELFKEISQSIFKIQSNNKRKYPLLVFGFGETEHLQHEKKYFDLGYANSWHDANKIAETIARISGNKRVNNAIIPELFPKADIRSLYGGKTKIEQDDLLIIIGKKDEVLLDENLKKKISLRINKLMKRTLLVQINNNDVTFNFRPKDFYN